jgi:Family of unknown function (DUF6812)
MSASDSALSGGAPSSGALTGSEPSGATLPQSEPSSGALPQAPADRGDHGSIDHRRERIRVQTATHRIEGNVTLARDGFRSRVSDMLNASERDFLTLTDATVTPIAGGPNERHGFLAVARRHIVFAVLADADERPPS